MSFLSLKPDDLHQNLVITSPTGSGKTTQVLRNLAPLLKNGVYTKIFIVGPTKASTFEIERKARREFEDENCDIVLRDDSDARLERNISHTDLMTKPVIVTTYERLDSILMSYKFPPEKTAIVIDEAHNLLNAERSTSLMNIMALAKMNGYRLILLSATMPELDSLAEYIGGKKVIHKERPVDLEIETKEVPLAENVRSDFYYLGKLHFILREIKEERKPILIYVPSKRLAEMVAKAIESTLDLKAVFHHAGVPLRKRREIEEELRKQNPEIDVVVATDTLSQSVNLAFRTVIVLGLKLFLRDEIRYVEPATVRQVVGRAGRPRFKERGKAIIVYTPDERSIVESALREDYGTISEPADYMALFLRLKYVGIPPDIWARNAYKVDPLKMDRAGELALDYDLIDKSGNLTPLGSFIAMEYVPSRAIPSLALALDSIYHNNLDVKRDALDLVLNMGFYMSSAWTNDRMFAEKSRGFELVSFMEDFWTSQEKGEQLSFEFCGRTYDFHIGDFAPILDDDAEWFPYYSVHFVRALSSPNDINIDSYLESLRKSARVLTRAAEEMMRPDYFFEFSRLTSLFTGYRVILRKYPDNPEIVRTYPRFMIRAIEKGLVTTDVEREFEKFLKKIGREVRMV